MAKMHDNELEIDEELVRRLLTVQFPQWADLPLARVKSAGTDNAIYRLGDDKVVRLPRIEWAVAQVEKEQRWLPELAPQLPFQIPVPLAFGQASDAYPWKWSVYSWLEGANATLERIRDHRQFVLDLAQFIIRLQSIDAGDGPPAGPHNSRRGVPLQELDAAARAGIEGLRGMIDIDLAAAAWQSVLKIPVWDGSPVWLHGDLQSGNLLANHGRLSAVIDFGCLGVGDPACDLQVAWNLFSSEMRSWFREVIQVDDDTWARGRGWALYFGLVALPYYHQSNPGLASIARHALDEALMEFKDEVDK